jgi:hypothetical protein
MAVIFPKEIIFCTKVVHTQLKKHVTKSCFQKYSYHALFVVTSWSERIVMGECVGETYVCVSLEGKARLF